MTPTTRDELARIRAELADLRARWKQESAAHAKESMRLRIKSEIALERHHQAVQALREARPY
jgi:hypothetical protein